MLAHCPFVHHDHIGTIFITTAYHDTHIAHGIQFVHGIPCGHVIAANEIKFIRHHHTYLRWR